MDFLSKSLLGEGSKYKGPELRLCPVSFESPSRGESEEVRAMRGQCPVGCSEELGFSE